MDVGIGALHQMIFAELFVDIWWKISWGRDLRRYILLI
jgi:hypothetical protein